MFSWIEPPPNLLKKRLTNIFKLQYDTKIFKFGSRFRLLVFFYIRPEVKTPNSTSPTIRSCKFLNCPISSIILETLIVILRSALLINALFIIQDLSNLPSQNTLGVRLISPSQFDFSKIYFFFKKSVGSLFRINTLDSPKFITLKVA